MRQLWGQLWELYAAPVRWQFKSFNGDINLANRNRPYFNWERGWYICLSWGNRLSDPVWSFTYEYGKCP